MTWREDANKRREQRRPSQPETEVKRGDKRYKKPHPWRLRARRLKGPVIGLKRTNGWTTIGTYRTEEEARRIKEKRERELIDWYEYEITGPEE